MPDYSLIFIQGGGIVMKKLLALILTFILAMSMVACNGSSNPKDESITISIASLKGPTSIGLVNLYNRSDNNETTNKYNYTIAGAADEISPKLISGEIDIAAVPCNLASVLYNKTEGEVVVAAVNTLGVLYILGKNVTDINAEDPSLESLKGKTIYTTGQGTTPEYTLRYLLQSAGIDPDKDVTIEFLSEASEVVSKISTLDSAVVMLPQPYATVAMTQDENLKILFDVTNEWNRLNTDSTVVTGVVVARKSFITEHEAAFKAFLEEYRESAALANTDVEGTATLVENYDIFKAAIAKKAIPYCNIVYIDGTDMKNKISSYLTVLFNANAASVGGTLPADDFYYIP